MALQVGAIALILLAGFSRARWPEPWRPWFGGAAVVVALLALPLFLGGLVSLGRQLTPFPKPMDGGRLQQGGAYRLARHPMYGGGLLLSLAWCLLRSPLALGPVALAVLLLNAKSSREEAWLLERYPDYEDYRRRVRWRMIPFVW